jgi:hypothetical protein
MGQSLIKVLSNDERVIVLSDAGERIFYTWNQSLTLQVWRQKSRFNTIGFGYEIQTFDEWDEVDVRTLPDVPTSFKKAREAAQRWQVSNRDPSDNG